MIYSLVTGYIGQIPGLLGVNMSPKGNVPTEDEMSDVIGDRWLSVDDIASYLGIKRDTVYKWIERKRMPAHKVGSLWKFKREEIDEWVRSGDASVLSGTRKPR